MTTDTPKNTTLEKFGTQQPDGSFKPFHLYSLKQAIEEGFILDVLANYTTYKGYYEIQKSIEDNPLFDTAKAQKKLRVYVESSQQTINTKAEIMVEDFMDNVVNAKKLRGKAKGMIVTQNRWCQTDSNQSLQGQRSCPLCRAEVAPLGESGGSVELEIARVSRGGAPG